MALPRVPRVRRLLAVALLLAPVQLGAQVRDTTRAAGDTVRRDTTLIPLPQRSDSVVEVRDSVKAPIAHAELPPDLDVGGRWRWGREDIFRSGASTLADLLDQVPGITTYRASWIATPQVAAFAGAFDRVRIFLDGFELDPIDPRMNGMPDLSFVQLWLLEEIMIERAPGEVRVHLRTWRETRTDPITRVDVSTGDLETNTYRGFYGKRFQNGGLLQIGAQQWSTVDTRGVDGDMVTLFARAGWAKGRWHGDVTFQRAARTATAQPRLGESLLPLPEQDARQGMYSARAGWGDPDSGPWVQLLAAIMQVDETSPRRAEETDGLPVDTVDTNTVRRQLVATGGIERWGVKLSGAVRLRLFDDESDVSPQLRLAWSRRWLSASAYAERSGIDSVTRLDGVVRVTPTSWLALSAGASQRTPDGNSDLRPTSRTLRAELGVRLGRSWLSGGLMQVDTLHTGAPTIFDATFDTFASGQRIGTFVGLRGPVWRDVGLDVTAVQWDSELDAYLPQYQVLTRLYLDTYWANRFPRRNLRILAQVQHEYRTEAGFPLTTSPGSPLLSSQYRTLGTLLEIRLYDAAIFWQFRNSQNVQYVTVPGFEMPRATNLYGIRWTFLN